MSKNRPGLVLTAGGARGAYQAGVLKRVGEIPALHGKPLPFPIVAGASAGAINGSCIAMGAHDFSAATRQLAELWSNIKSQDVYRTDPMSLGGLAAQWVRDLSMGGLWGGGKAQSLLDAGPLRDFLQKNLNFSEIQSRIHEGHLYALAVTATNYYSGKSFTFIQGQKGHPLWERSRRLALSSPLTVDHICASSSIPIVFQPVKLATPLGDFYFGDGGLRLVTPLSPAIRLGASRLFAIGIRSQVAAEDRTKKDLLDFQSSRPTMKRPPVAQVIGVVLNSIFLDHLDTDVDHLNRINEIVRGYGLDGKTAPLLREPMRVVEAMIVSPSTDLAKVAETYADRLPPVIRYFLEGLGNSRAESADLMSYLLFDRAYTQALVDLGYHDASRQIEAIEAFIRQPAPASASAHEEPLAKTR